MAVTVERLCEICRSFDEVEVRLTVRPEVTFAETELPGLDDADVIRRIRAAYVDAIVAWLNGNLTLDGGRLVSDVVGPLGAAKW